MNNANEKLFFIGIGAAKTGTTWLSELLRANPYIFLPPEKELIFFSSESNYSKGIEWYKIFFKNASPQQKKGEFSVNYLEKSSLSAKRIYDYNSKIKLILVIRDPVERSLSHYKWFKQLNIPVGSFLHEIENGTPVALNSLYFQQFLPFIDLFSRDQYHIIKYDDILTCPTEVIRKLSLFLEIEPSLEDQKTQSLINKRIGKTINPRFRSLENFRIKTFEWLRAKNLSSLISLSRTIGLSSLYRNLNHTKTSDKNIIESHELLTAFNYFEEDLKKFSGVTQIDVTSWITRYQTLKDQHSQH